jgi:hypothetical protein
MRAIATDETAIDSAESSGCRVGELADIDAGGFADAVVRIMVALAHAGSGTRRRSLAAYDGLAGRDIRLTDVHGATLSAMIKKQSAIMKSAPEAALSALPGLLPCRADRQKALAIAAALMVNEPDSDPQVIRMRDAIAAVMGI